MNTTDKISKIIEVSIEESKKNNSLPKFDSKKIIVEKPKNKSFGNWSTNIALTLSKELKKKPLEIAGIIKSNITNSSIIETVEIIPPGFINFRLSNSFRSDNYKTSAIGLLHEEMRKADSLIFKVADQCRLPAGEAWPPRAMGKRACS